MLDILTYSINGESIHHNLEVSASSLKEARKKAISILEEKIENTNYNEPNWEDYVWAREELGLEFGRVSAKLKRLN